MVTPAQILAELGIRRRRASAYTTTCPRCSETRKKKSAECLSVAIDERGVRALCHHCGWKVVEFYDERHDYHHEQERRPNDHVVPPNGNSRRAIETWAEGVPLLGSPGQDCLIRRRIYELPRGIEGALRYHARCPFDGARKPCIVALFRDVLTNEPKAIHRIAIDGSGKWSLGPKSGCAIKLSADDEVEQGLTIGEGVETTLAAWQFGFRPAWACGDAANLRAFPVLPGLDGLHVIVDNDAPDKNGVRKGPEAALECSARWTAAGRDVYRVVPCRRGADFNDVVRVR